MDVAKIVLLGTVSIGTAVVEQILQSFGKSQEAQYVKISGMATVGVVALTCVKDIFDAVRGL